jgi:polysaccharide export outer membrane protein
VAEVSLSSVVEATHPGDNFLIQAEDVVSVPKADMVYVLGEVHKAGGFVVRDGPSSVSVALALAEGWLPTAAPDQARLLRVVPGSAERTQLNVNIKKVMAGKAPDVRLQAGDILFIPNSKAKSATLRTLETAIQIGTGIAIFHP